MTGKAEIPVAPTRIDLFAFRKEKVEQLCGHYPAGIEDKCNRPIAIIIKVFMFTNLSPVIVAAMETEQYGHDIGKFVLGRLRKPFRDPLSLKGCRT